MQVTLMRLMSKGEYLIVPKGTKFKGAGKLGLNDKIWPKSVKKMNKDEKQSVKGIVTDSNNIFLWHESEDINKKSLFPKFQLIPSSNFQVMHDNVCFIAPIDYCVK